VRQFGVSRVTVRRTLDQLETEGLIRRVRGRGTFPAERADLPDAAAKTNISSLLENLLSFEQTTTAVNLEWGEVAPAGEAARALGREPCLRIVRVRRYEGRPISLTTIHVPRRFAALLDPGASADEPIIRLLDCRGVRAEGAEQVITGRPRAWCRPSGPSGWRLRLRTSSHASGAWWPAPSRSTRLARRVASSWERLTPSPPFSCRPCYGTWTERRPAST
jgi:hypothetical protein